MDNSETTGIFVLPLPFTVSRLMQEWVIVPGAIGAIFEFVFHSIFKKLSEFES
jgi:hypothetical protein